MTGCNPQSVIFVHGGSAFSRYDDFLAVLKTRPLRDLPGTDPAKKWSQTLREELGADFSVYTPNMPNSQNAKYLEWKIWFERYLTIVQSELVLVGWSQGGMFLAKYLSENTPKHNIKALFLLAAPFDCTDDSGEDGGDFRLDPNLLPSVSSKVDKIYLFHSTDDPIVPYPEVLRFKEAWSEASLTTFNDKNHFLIAEFPELVNKIRGFGI